MKTVILTIAPLAFRPRVRKIASVAREYGSTTVVSLASAGRLPELRVAPGWRYEDGLEIVELPMPELQLRADYKAMAYNAARAYAPALLRLARVAAARGADAVIASNTEMLPVGLLHKIRHKSSLILNAHEHPTGIRQEGSLASVVSRAAAPLLRTAALHTDFVFAACDSHAAAFRGLGFRDVRIIRNLPALGFTPPTEPLPPSASLTVAYVGSLFPGRGLEPLIAAVGALRREGEAVRVEVTGFASPEYERHLRMQVKQLNLEDSVAFLGSCPSHEVFARYSRAHIGCALYEPRGYANDSLSNKLFEIMAAGRAVLGTTLSETRAVVESIGCGSTCEVTPEDIARALKWFLAHREEVAAMGARARTAIETSLHWEQEAGKVREALSAIAASAGAPLADTPHRPR